MGPVPRDGTSPAAYRNTDLALRKFGRHTPLFSRGIHPNPLPKEMTEYRSCRVDGDRGGLF